MTQEVAQETAVEAPEATEVVESAESPEVAEQEQSAVEAEETLEEKYARLEKERDALKKGVERLKADKHRYQGETRAERQLRMQYEQALRGGQNQGEQRQVTQADIEREVSNRVQMQTFSREIEQINEQGQKAFKDFDSKVNELDGIAQLVDDNNRPTALMLEIKGCEAPHKVIAYLADNPDIAEGLANANRSQIARKLALIERDAMSSPAVSKAPPPIKPIGSKGSGAQKSPEDMSHEEYRAWRKQQGARWAK